ncbi:MAG TPA: hypothetical protein VLI54_01955 [Bacillota bacterium]|nr:hypothetical protein [Bacillota bacterium]
MPFILIFITLFSLVRAFARNYAKPLSGNVRLAVLGAALPTLLLVLRSLGQLTLRDVITVMALFVITYFYVGRSVSPSSV